MRLRSDLGGYETILTYDDGNVAIDRRVTVGGIPLMATRQLGDIAITATGVGKLEIAAVDFKS